MRELARQQAGFAAAMVDAARTPEALELFSGDAARVTARLAIYRGNVLANATKALGAAYPVIAQLVGEAFFDGLAREYARRHPSASGDLNEYGARFGEFLEAFAPARELPYLPDVARMEWLAHHAHYAADCEPLGLERLARVPEADYGELILVAHPACGVLASPYPLARIWAVHQSGHDGAVAVEFDGGPHHALISRPTFRARVDEIAPGAFAFLCAALRGDRIADALEAAVAVDPQFDLAATLAWAVEGRAVVDFRLPVP